MEKRILIIDDDRELSMLIKDMLEDNGYEVCMAATLDEAYTAMQEQMPLLILLDINLPDGTGFELCEDLRQKSQVPIIFASARTGEYDKITGLDMGGDDYLAKPYSIKELMSRINSLIRRTYGNDIRNQIISLKFAGNREISIDKNSRIVKLNDRTVELAPKEYELLVYMADHRGKAMTKQELIDNVWGAYSEVEQSTLTVHIRWLREKFEENPSVPVIFRTVWGVGYMFGE